MLNNLGNSFNPEIYEDQYMEQTLCLNAIRIGYNLGLIDDTFEPYALAKDKGLIEDLGSNEIVIRQNRDHGLRLRNINEKYEIMESKLSNIEPLLSIQPRIYNRHDVVHKNQNL